jgi:predicted phosphate transport protein (TIGR00153 family)
MRIFQDRNKELEMQLDLYLNFLQKGANTFLEGVKSYLRGETDIFMERIKTMTEFESDADDHLVNLKYVLFKYNLMPDLSADILELVDSMDDINDISKEVLLNLQVVKPKIDASLVDDFGHIAKKSKQAAETLINGVRIYFTEFKTIEDYVTKVKLYESEVDQLLYHLKVKIYNEKFEASLCEKMMLQNFADEVAKLSDLAEQIADKLSVFKFKRSM